MSGRVDGSGKLVSCGSFAIVSFFTGGYNRYFRSLYESFRHHFFPGSDRTFFVFTDNPFIDEPDVVRIPIDGEGFYNALRFRYLSEISGVLRKFDHVLVLNANAVALQTMHPDVHDEDEMFLAPLFGSTTGLAHPPYLAVCSDPTSTAYIDRDREDISVYWRGCLWGGRPGAVLPMVREVDAWLREDGIRRDELHVNRYFVSHKDEALVLDARYAWSGAWGNNPYFDIRIVMADKEGRYGELRRGDLPRDLLRSYAVEPREDGGFYLGPGVWHSEVLPVASRPSSDGEIPGGRLIRTGRVRRVVHAILPPVLIQVVRWLQRYFAVVRSAPSSDV